MKNNIIFIVFDSCRFDSFQAAKTPNIDRLGKAEQRYSYASWTVPSHAVYMMGVSPHKNPRRVFASDVYQKDFVNWGDRIGIEDVSFKEFVPRLSLAHFLKQQGYRTTALVSMPVLNQMTVLAQHYDRYQLMKAHNDFSAIIDELWFDDSQPAFYFLNIGETHYPYCIPGESNELPRISGVHGVLKHMDDLILGNGGNADDEFFDEKTLQYLHEKQKKNVEYLDSLFEKLYDVTPRNTHFIVTADHGELFGEEGFFGHGPVFHEKVFEVFFTEGKLS